MHRLWFGDIWFDPATTSDDIDTARDQTSSSSLAVKSESQATNRLASLYPKLDDYLDWSTVGDTILDTRQGDTGIFIIY